MNAKDHLSSDLGLIWRDHDQPPRLAALLWGLDERHLAVELPHFEYRDHFVVSGRLRAGVTWVAAQTPAIGGALSRGEAPTMPAPVVRIEPISRQPLAIDAFDLGKFLLSRFSPALLASLAR